MDSKILNEVIINDQVFKNKEELGKGGFGVIYKYTRDTDTKLGNKYDNLNMLKPLENAKEIIIKYDLKEENKIETIKNTEIILDKLNREECGDHFSNFGIYTNDKEKYIIMEKAPFGDLSTFIQNKLNINGDINKGIITDHDFWKKIHIQLLEILNCLKKNYENKIIDGKNYSRFQDFKEQNILVYNTIDNPKLKLGDVDSWGVNIMTPQSLSSKELLLLYKKKKEDEKITNWLYIYSEKYNILRIINNYLSLYDYLTYIDDTTPNRKLYFEKFDKYSSSLECKVMKD